MAESVPQGLVLLWVTKDKEAAQNMVFMYSKNAKVRGWWDRVRLLIWGPSAKLLAEDVELQQQLQELRSAGVELIACKACADRYGVSGKLEKLGVEVFYVGASLTEYIKEGWATLSV